MPQYRPITLCFVLFCSLGSAPAQLRVIVSPPKITAQKAIVPLAIKNSFSQKIQSARAVVFLLDEQGKVTSQATRWVIGGSQDKSGLAPSATNSFYFVITNDKPFTTTNLTAKVQFTRVILENGKLADPKKDVEIRTPPK